MWVLESRMNHSIVFPAWMVTVEMVGGQFSGTTTALTACVVVLVLVADVVVVLVDVAANVVAVFCVVLPETTIWHVTVGCTESWRMYEPTVTKVR